MHAPASPPPALDHRICSGCDARVLRAEVHKNRYGQYTCKACRSNGVPAVGRRRLHHVVQRMPTALLTFLVVMLVLVLVPLAFFLLAQLHSYSNGGLVDDLKDLVRSINQSARRHAESAPRRYLPPQIPVRSEGWRPRPGRRVSGRVAAPGGKACSARPNRASSDEAIAVGPYFQTARNTRMMLPPSTLPMSSSL